jgi:streptomycin 6-kinase
LADKYNQDKRRVIEYWAISKMNIGATWHQLDKRHLYELSKISIDKTARKKIKG